MRDFEYETFREDKKHTEVAFPYNTYLCSIPLDFSSVPVHWHEEMELIVVKKGRGLVTLDRESRLLEAGQAVIVLPGQLHGIRQYQQERMEYENIIFRLEMLLPKEGDVCGPKFLEPYRDGKLLYPAWIDGSALYHEEMLECIRKMDELSEQRPRGCRLYTAKLPESSYAERNSGICRAFPFLFLTSFKKKYGVPPASYRKRKKELTG